jgi:hypothetical protein
MNLVDMRDLFRKHTSSLSQDLADVEVDSYLNRAYQYTIPLDVGGEFMEHIWELRCIAGQAAYPYPDPVVAPSNDSPWIDSHYDNSNNLIEDSRIFLGVDTNPSVFWSRYGVQSQGGRPTRILFYGKEATFSYVPEIEYVVSIPSRSGPLLPLDDSGINHGTHAMAVVTASAMDYLSEIEDVNDPGVNREANLYQRYLGQLQTYAQARPNKRRPARSF